MSDRKTVLVTGGAGFVGSHLCERLAREGHRVISLDNYFTGSKDNHIDGVEYREGHTKDISNHITETPDIIFHLGEYARVEQSVLEPDVVHDLNVNGTEGVVAFWKQTRAKLVYAGSSTKFGDAGKARHTSPYASTKAANSELVCREGEAADLEYAVTYFYNVYGERERSGVYGTVIEHFKRMYLSGSPCAIVSPGTQQRNFTHVEDIVDGLVRVAADGQGDEYGLGNEAAYSIFDVAKMFGLNDNAVMFPERPGNRMTSALDTSKARLLGWKPQKDLSDYIKAFISHNKPGERKDKRVLVFSTTFHPIVGLAEESFAELAQRVPDVQFDVVTTKFSRSASDAKSPAENVTVHRVGFGARFDKFLLPILGTFVGMRLRKKHTYLFVWSLMASYGAFAGIFFRKITRIPLLVTLADQNIDDLTSFRRFLFSVLLSRADQVYGTHNTQEMSAAEAAGASLPRNTLGEGDAFANALRYAYADQVRKKFE